MAKKSPPEKKSAGSPAWMSTYGDMVTLILTFFVLLFSFSSMDSAKWDEVVQAFTGVRFIAIQPLDPAAAIKGFDVPTPRPTPRDTSAEEAQQEAFDELYERIQGTIEESNLTSTLGLEKTEDYILLRMKDSALFDSGRSEIKQEAMELLRDVSLIFDEYASNIAGIQIEGHTDNVPISNDRYLSNWELSASRASQVLQFFLANSIVPPQKYTMAGCGEYRPVATNDTEAGKAQNRRVDFIIRSILYSDEGEVL